jgi:hypothetical protein
MIKAFASIHAQQSAINICAQMGIGKLHKGNWLVRIV